jgi:hypothetical protein
LAAPPRIAGSDHPLHFNTRHAAPKKTIVPCQKVIDGDHRLVERGVSNRQVTLGHRTGENW